MQISKKTDNPFVKIHQSLGAELTQVDEIIKASSQGKADLIGKITNHLVFAGGKRVRPILTLLSSKICNYQNGHNNLKLAAAVELIHSATLLHDDVVDESNLRRGKKTANAIWNNKTSILVGDYMLSVAFQLMVQSESLEVLDILSKTSGIMADGEVLQLMNSHDIAILEEKYLEIISCKTAILFTASAEIGAVISNADQQKQQALADFGNNLGIAFQIIDDILDYSATQENLGKDIGNDFFEGKVTLPIILTYKQANDDEKAKIKEIFLHNLTNKDKNEKSFAQMMQIMAKYNALELTTKKAQYFYQLAQNNLNIFAPSPEKTMLLEILDYAISRQK